MANNLVIIFWFKIPGQFTSAKIESRTTHKHSLTSSHVKLMPVRRGGGALCATAPSFWVRFLYLLYLLFFACVLVMEVGDVRRYPYPVSGKLTQMF